MMDMIGTLLREKNIQLFLEMSQDRTLKAAAKRAGIAYSHARRLVKCWEKAGIVTWAATLHGRKVVVTDRGLALFLSAQDFMKSVKEAVK